MPQLVKGTISTRISIRGRMDASSGSTQLWAPADKHCGGCETSGGSESEESESCGAKRNNGSCIDAEKVDGCFAVSSSSSYRGSSPALQRDETAEYQRPALREEQDSCSDHKQGLRRHQRDEEGKESECGTQ